MSFIKFIFSKYFLINLGLVILITGLSIWGVFEYLENYTNHGETITVPDLKEMKVEEIDEFLSKKTLRYEILDSVYETGTPGGAILKQNPKAGSKVKENRKIYITVNAMEPPNITVPDFVDMSMRQAKSLIETYGLKLGEIEYEPDPCKNCVIAQKIDGDEVEPGTDVPKGTKIDLVLGQGTSDEMVLIPQLTGLNKSSAKDSLHAQMLNIGAEVYDETVKTEEDSLHAIIYKQLPPYQLKGTINMGSSIDIFLTTDKNKVDANPPSEQTDTVPE